MWCGDGQELSVSQGRHEGKGWAGAQCGVEKDGQELSVVYERKAGRSTVGYD